MVAYYQLNERYGGGDILIKPRHKILIIADSHARGMVVKLQHNLEEDYSVQGLVKSGAASEATLGPDVKCGSHDLSHPGTKATAKLVAQRFMWPGMQKDCRTWARVCQACQRSKVSHHAVTPVGDFTLPAAHLLHVHIDRVGPLPTSAGYTYCLTAVDRFTRWPEAIPNHGHHSRHRGTRPTDQLDIPLRLPSNHHHRPGTSV
jgi:hypothetical protein